MFKVLLGILLGIAITTTVVKASKEEPSNPKDGVPCVCPPDTTSPPRP